MRRDSILFAAARHEGWFSGAEGGVRSVRTGTADIETRMDARISEFYVIFGFEGAQRRKVLHPMR